MARRYTRRPIITGRAVTDEQKARNALNLAIAILDDNLGEDEKPSALLTTLATFDDVDAAGLEIVQDCGLFGRRIIEIVRDNLGNPEAFAQALLFEAMAFAPEIKGDIEAATK